MAAISNTTCAVCLNSADPKKDQWTPCFHLFHKDTCLKPWVQIHHKCPTCRTPFNPAFEQSLGIAVQAAAAPVFAQPQQNQNPGPGFHPLGANQAWLSPIRNLQQLDDPLFQAVNENRLELARDLYDHAAENIREATLGAAAALSRTNLLVGILDAAHKRFHAIDYMIRTGRLGTARVLIPRLPIPAYRRQLIQDAIYRYQSDVRDIAPVVNALIQTYADRQYAIREAIEIPIPGAPDSPRRLDLVASLIREDENEGADRGYAVRHAVDRNQFELARLLLQHREEIPEADRLSAMNGAIIRDYRGVSGFCRTDADRGYVLLTAIGEGKLSLAQRLLQDGNNIPEADRIAAIRKMVRRDPRDLVYLQDLLILTRRHRLIAACASDKIQMAIIAMIALMVAAIAPYIGQEKS